MPIRKTVVFSGDEWKKVMGDMKPAEKFTDYIRRKLKKVIGGEKVEIKKQNR